MKVRLKNYEVFWVRNARFMACLPNERKVRAFGEVTFVVSTKSLGLVCHMPCASCVINVPQPLATQVDPYLLPNLVRLITYRLCGFHPNTKMFGPLNIYFFGMHFGTSIFMFRVLKHHVCFVKPTNWITFTF